MLSPWDYQMQVSFSSLRPPSLGRAPALGDEYGCWDPSYFIHTLSSKYNKEENRDTLVFEAAFPECTPNFYSHLTTRSNLIIMPHLAAKQSVKCGLLAISLKTTKQNKTKTSRHFFIKSKRKAWGEDRSRVEGAHGAKRGHQ